jgi:sulfhydrogenase subunit alpha
MKDKARTIQVNHLARVEGEGSLTIRMKGAQVTEVQLGIFEPPRFFEAFLRGRSYLEAPDITARICGICPVAYLMSACHAMEDALGIAIEPSVRALRRLLYAGEWIESHALHVFLLHAPDFLGYPDAMTMAKDHGEWVKKGLRIKKGGNAVVDLLGGREIHPINIRVGGFYRAPSRAELQSLLPELTWSRDATAECLRWMAGLSFPALERQYEFVALRHPDEYPFCEGRLVSSEGLDIAISEYDDHFVEEHVPYANALHSRLRARGAYLTGPLARFNLDFGQLFPDVQALARETGITPPCGNPFKMLLVRLVETAQAIEDAIRIIEDYVPPAAPYVDGPLRAGTGYGVTEAPRGFLYHRYTVDDTGTILDAKLVPPTAQNQFAIEQDLAELAPLLAELPLPEATHRAEQAVRNHDPCISCATHFLTLRVVRE